LTRHEILNSIPAGQHRSASSYILFKSVGGEISGPFLYELAD